MPNSTTVTFSDPYEYQTSHREALQKLVVTARGKYRAKITSVELHRLWMLRGWHSLPTVSHAALREDQSPIVFPTDARQPPSVNNGVEVKPGEMVVTCLGGEYHARTPPTEALGFTVADRRDVTVIEPAQCSRWSCNDHSRDPCPSRGCQSDRAGAGAGTDRLPVGHCVNREPSTSSGDSYAAVRANDRGAQGQTALSNRRLCGTRGFRPNAPLVLPRASWDGPTTISLVATHASREACAHSGRPGQDRRDHNRQRPRLHRTRTFCCYVPANVRRGTVYDVAPVSLTQDGWGAGIPGARFTRARLTTHPAGRI